MERNEMKEIFKIIANVYPNFGVTSEKLDTWHELLGDQTFSNVKQKTKEHVLRQKFPPTISEIRTPVKPPIREKTDEEKKQIRIQELKDITRLTRDYYAMTEEEYIYDEAMEELKRLE